LDEIGNSRPGTKQILEEQLEAVKKKIDKDQSELNDYLVSMFKGTDQIPDISLMNAVTDAVRNENMEPLVKLISVASAYQKQSVMKVEEQYQNEKKSREDMERKLKESEQARLEKERAWKEVLEKLEHQQKVQNEMAKFSTPSKSEPQQTTSTPNPSNQSQQQQNSKSSDDIFFEESRRPTKLPETFVGKPFSKAPFVNEFMELYKQRNGMTTLSKIGNEKIPYFQEKFQNQIQQNQVQPTKN